jgi:hypothetical protein
MFTHNSNLLDENPVLFELNSIRQKGRFSEWSKKACPTYLYDSERHIIDVIFTKSELEKYSHTSTYFNSSIVLS